VRGWAPFGSRGAGSGVDPGAEREDPWGVRGRWAGGCVFVQFDVGVRFSGCQTSREGDRTLKFAIRKAFKKYGLEPTGELFDRAYAYVAEHY
jgi:hypothetical protein